MLDAGVLCLALGACLKPGGGGSLHVPPASIPRGTPFALELELTSVHESPPIDRQMTRITCHYRLAGGRWFTPLAMAPTGVIDRKLVARAVLPAFPREAAGPVEYYFDYHFDGVHNSHNSASDPFQVPFQ